MGAGNRPQILKLWHKI